MGASSIHRVLDGKLTPDQLQQRYREMSDDDAHEHGHSYSGGWNMCPGLIIHRDVLPTVEEAIDWLDERAEKWESAHACRARRVVKKLAKQPTFNGQPYKGIMGVRCVGIDDYGMRLGDKVKHVPADQLTPEEVEEYLRLRGVMMVASRKYRETRNALEQAVKGMWDHIAAHEQAAGVHLTRLPDSALAREDTPAPKPPAELTRDVSIQHEFNELCVQLVAFEAALKPYKAFYDKMIAKLYAEETVDEGEVWVVFGVAAE